MRVPIMQRVVAVVAAAVLVLAGVPAAASSPSGSATVSRGETVRVEGTLRVAAADIQVDVDEYPEHHLSYALQVGAEFIALDPAGTADLEGASDGAAASIEIAATPELTRALAREGVDVAALGSRPLPPAAVAALQRGPAPAVVAARVAPVAAPAATKRAHSVYVVLIQDAGAGAAVTAAQAAAVVRSAESYWVAQSNGFVSSFAVEASRTLNLANSCRTDNTWDMWEAAAALYPGVDFTNQPNHLLVLKSAKCVASLAGQGTVGVGVGSGGLLWSTGTHLHTLIHELGHNFSLFHANLASLHEPSKSLEYWALYGPMSMGLSRPGGGEFDAGVLDVGYQDVLGVLPAGQVRSVGSETVTLSPVTGSTGTRGAKFIDPASGVPVYIEYRDGKRGDAGTFYEASRLTPYYMEPPTPRSVIDACVARHGATAVQCETLGYYRPGVVVYEMSADRNLTVIPVPRGLGYDASLAQGKQVTGRGGGYTVKADRITGSSATVTIRIAKNAATVAAVPRDTAVGSPSLDVTVRSKLTPTGTVTVHRGSTQVGTGTLSGGTATVQLDRTLALGAHQLTVRYGGSATANAAQTTASITVTKRTPRVTIALGKTFRGVKTKGTVTVSSPAGAQGKVVLRVNGKKRATLRLSGGQANFRLPKKLKLGKHKVRAVYRGDTNHRSAARTVKIKIVKKKAKIKSFASGRKRVAAGKRYRDDVRLSHRGTLQRKSGKRWVRVKAVPKGKSTVAIKAGRRGTATKYRIFIKATGKVKAKKSKVLTLRTR